jgi:hypothetical protein
MDKLIIAALIAASLSGCASRTSSASYGNFAPDSAPAEDRLMADDVAKKLAALHLPARSRINLIHATPDAFGGLRVSALRTKGYALAEFKPGSAALRSASSDASGPNDLALAYVVDRLPELRMYRVTVHINDQSLSRLYEAKDGKLTTAGYWVRKE